MNEKFIVKGVEPVAELCLQSLGEQLFYKLKEYGDHSSAIINALTNEAYSHREILDKSCSLAIYLKKCGLNESHIVGMFSKNSLNYIIPIAASMYLGIPVALFKPTDSTVEFAHMANISKPSVIFCTEDTFITVLKAKQKLNFAAKIILMDVKNGISHYDHLEDLIKAAEQDLNSFTPTPINVKERPAFILYSSGTTGLPKGVVLTHHNYNTALAFTRDPRFFPQPLSQSVMLNYLPFYHGFGLFMLLCGIIGNRKLVIMQKFEPRLFLHAIGYYKITSLALVPPIATFMVKDLLVDEYDTSSINDVLCGAAPLGKEVEELFQKRFNLPLRQGYGMTEATMISNILPIGANKSGSVGVLLPYFSAKVVDVDTGKAVGPMEMGEICFKGAGIMKGYANNSIATREIIDEDGWLHSGDIGYYDHEHFFYIKDRLKELIKYNGQQVPPAEIEAVLITHPKILDTGVVGLPDKRYGELPLAFVVKSPKSDLTEEEVQQFVKEQLSPANWLRGGVRFVREIPKNPSGKILRRELRQLVAQQKSKL